MNRQQFEYIFHCPLHGCEREVFCWRTFDVENLSLWKKYKTEYSEVEFTADEKTRIVEYCKGSENRVIYDSG